MALYLNTNIQSLVAQRNLRRITDDLDLSYERLSTGLRINSAKDDPAGVQIADRLTSQIDHLAQGNRNAQDCISYAQTAEGAFEEITNMLQRIRTIAIEAANGTFTAADRQALQQEVDQLNAEICRIAEDTTFAGQDLLNGKAGVVYFQVGADPNSVVSIDMSMGFATSSIAAYAAKLSGSSFTVDANEVTAGGTYYYENLFTSGEGGIDVSTSSSAQLVLAGIDALISAVDTKRAELGAIQTRMEATIRNQSNVSENVQSSRSIIRDTDWAEEVSKMTQNQVLQEATATILTQANTRPQIALQLLSTGYDS